MGERLTWLRLNKTFPGHGLSFRQVAEFVAACPNCCKTRLRMQNTLQPLIRSLKPPEARTAIGIDAVTITPAGKDGHTHITVVVNLFTKFVSLHPVKGVTALNLAAAVWKHWCNFGHTDMIISDKGPDLTSILFQHLTTYMGVRRVFSITDRHANGCERTIGEVVRHLRVMVYDETYTKTLVDVFEDPTWLDSVQYILNSEVNSETNYSPFELTYGSDASFYMHMARGMLTEKVHARVSKLNADLRNLRELSKKYQAALVTERQDAGVQPHEQNTYKKGDFVLFDKGAKVHPKCTTDILDHMKLLITLAMMLRLNI